MDIQLQTSRYLLLFRLSITSLAILAVLISNLDVLYKLLLILFVVLQLFAILFMQDPVCRLQIIKGCIVDEDKSGQQIIAELRSTRRIAFRLEASYSLWWIQILYLSSAGGSAIVPVLPDSCSADERRLLRQYLYRHY